MGKTGTLGWSGEEGGRQHRVDYVSISDGRSVRGFWAGKVARPSWHVKTLDHFSQASKINMLTVENFKRR